jgi:hypothetical protein
MWKSPSGQYSPCGVWVRISVERSAIGSRI